MAETGLMAKTVRVEGLKELDQALGELSKAGARGVLRRVAVKALGPFDSRWRELAPKLEGHLSESGGIGTKLTRRQAAENKTRTDRAFVEVFAGPNDPAAVPQEFGTVELPPQPFARPAWEETKGTALDIVKAELGGEIDKAAKRAARRAAKKAAAG